MCSLYVVSAVVSFYESLPNEGEADIQVENEEAPTENEEAPTENAEAPTDDWQMLFNMIVEHTTKQSRRKSKPQ